MIDNIEDIIGRWSEETIISPDEKNSITEAYQVLQEIRAAYPIKSGYVEIQGYIEPLSNGNWRAVRKHKKYDR